MPYTYEYITGTVLGSNTSTVQFSNIPQTFTDLELRIIARGNNGSNTFDHMVFTVNNNTNSIYNTMFLRVDGGASPAIIGSISSSVAYGLASYIQGPGAPANSFGTGNIYFFNYASSSAYKPWRWHSANEYNVSPRYQDIGGGIVNTNTAISSIEIVSTQFSITSYQTGSAFYLYGIKKS